MIRIFQRWIDQQREALRAGWKARLTVGLMLGLTAGLLTGCAGPQLSDHAGQKPDFDFRQYFSGKVQAQGLVTDRGGKLLRRFVVTLNGQWSGDQGTLDEQFVYDDGERQHRIWRITQLVDGRFIGRADDVVGMAEGAQAGAAFRWQYTLRVPVDGRELELQFDDWMFRVDERTVINRATMRKFGFRVGEVLLSFQRVDGV